jgi:hypothetical protein
MRKRVKYRDMPMQSCMLSQPALAEWKERSIFSFLEKAA